MNNGYMSFTLAVCLIGSAVFTQAATLLVDKTGRLDADYQSLSEAMEAAKDGDTIHLAPSNVPYGNLILNKSIRLIGAGIPSEDLLPWRAGQHSRINELTFQPGSDGALVMGCEIQYLKYLNPNKPELEHPHGVTFFRNWLRSTNIDLRQPISRPLNNLRLINNMTGDITIIVDEQDVNDLQLLNNVINAYISISSRTPVTGVCRNNLIFEDGRRFLSFGNWRLNFVDNIVLVTGDTTRITSDHWPNLTAGNVFIGEAPLEPEDENKNLQLPREAYQSVFPDWTNSEVNARTAISAAAWARIADGHPAKTAGIDDDEPGIFGGLHPFDRYQMPPLPFISRVEAPAIVNEGEGLRVTVEIKSQN